MNVHNKTKNLWEKVHVDYSFGKLSIFSEDSNIGFIKKVCDRHLINIDLYINNFEIQNILNNKEIYLAHFPKNIQDIINSGKVFSSAGCLVGSIYCTQVIKNGSAMFLSDLGSYLANYEIPKSLKSVNGAQEKPKECILFSIKKEDTNNLFGINYLDLGELHYEVFQSLSYLLSRQELAYLETEIVSKAQKIKNIQRIASYLKQDKKSINMFFDTYSASVKHIPLLGYILFEGITLYVSLCAQDDYSKTTRSKGFIPNKIYKMIIFESRKNLYKNFSLASLDFNYKDLKELIFLLNEKEDTRINFNHFIYFLADFCIEAISKYLIPEDYVGIESLRDVHGSQKKIIGHTVHRLLRGMTRNQDFYFYFEQSKALSVWNFWNKEHVQIPFNGIIPKGEFGINPADPTKEINVYVADLEYVDDQQVNVLVRKRIDCAVIPRLVDLKHSFMRNK